MKRLAWILIAVLCTALARVQPADMGIDRPVCSCCEQPGACGLPECVVPVLPASAFASLSASTESVRIVARGEAPGSPRDSLSLVVKAPTAIRAMACALERAKFPARVPLFEEHCSLLI